MISLRAFLGQLRLAVVAALFLASFPAMAQQSDVQTSWRLLDYLAVDYAGAVSPDGRVISPAEYAEMQEFSATAAEQLKALPAEPEKARLNADAARLQAAIARKAPPAEVAALARGLGQALLKAYPVAMGPAAAPDLGRGAKLFAVNCSSCHGQTGAADTPMARQLDPPPVAFTDRARAAERSPFALYQVINQGLEGTAMTSFSGLPDQDKWALAFHAGRLAYPEPLVAEGKRLWQGDPKLHTLVPNLDALSGLSERALAQRVGEAPAAALIAYLRTHPEALAADASTSLGLAKQRLAESLAAYESGDRDKAKALALSAYLDGFEPVEAVLSARNGGLMVKVEQAMAELRAAIAAGKPAAEVRAKVAALDALFSEVELALAPDQDSALSAFLGAMTILLREGLEALLIVIAMLAFLKKAEQPAMARPVHYGWIGALAAGGLTWWAATSLISVSGASRELTEGFGSLLAAVVLLFVGIWMHGKAQAGQWQRYIQEKMSQAMTGRSAWFLFALAFVAVYREVFETILFYAAMAAQGHVEAIVAGGLVGAAALAAIAIAMLRFSQRLPIAKFFTYSSALVAVLAVVLAGKGVAALQEAGLLGVYPIGGLPRLSILGLFPTAQGIAAQLLALLILIAGFAWNRRAAFASASTA
jgi:high-affinity iron transporter